MQCSNSKLPVQVPLFFRREIKTAREMAFESSLTTHPGPLAAEACAFLAHMLVRAFEREDEEPAVAFIDRTVAEYFAWVSAHRLTDTDD